MDSTSTTSNPWKSGNSRRLLKAIFYEMTLADKSSVVYTLKDHDHEGFPSLYKLYMAADDPTEYKFATTHLESLAHWEELCACTWFKPYAERWRRELELRLKSIALARIMSEAENTLGKNAFHANKYLVEKGWIPKEVHTKGRPSKDQIRDEAIRIAEEDERITNDHARILQ